MNEKLIKIQNELSVPKNQRNTFGNYNYRSCEDILEALKPLLKDHKLLLTISDELVNIGSRYYVKATVRLVNMIFDNNEKAVNSIETTGFSREEEVKKGMDQSQITGASSSYARKYALNAMFLIDDTKDSDSTNLHDNSTTIQGDVIARPQFAVAPRAVDPTTYTNEPVARPVAAQAADVPTCPTCGGDMWDNRYTKLNPKAPDFKCKNKECSGVVWHPHRPVETPKEEAVTANDDEAPFESEEPPISDEFLESIKN